MIKKTLLTLALASQLFSFESKYIPNTTIDIKCSQIIYKSAYDICYSYKFKTPLLTAYTINGDSLSGKHYNRKGLTFKPDYSVPIKYRAYTRDYSHTGFDRGHLCPNAVFNTNKKLQKETFVTSNIAPEKPQLNRRLWAKIERFARFQARKHGYVNVITGVCGSLGHIRNNVNIPAYWYKIIIYPNDKSVAFLAPNTNNGMSRAKAKDFIVPISEIEQRCDIRFEKK